MTALLAGVRVLDMGRLVAPAYASGKLRDLGAEVTKVELAPLGDYLRSVPPLKNGVGVLHWELSRGKQSLALDWRQPRARDLLYRLVAEADVFIESTMGDAAARMGVDWETLQPRNPRLVHCSITSFGRGQPYADLRAHGLNIDAAAGVAPVTTDAHGHPEIGRLTHWVASQAAGLNAALAITAALFAREQTGVGRHIDVSCWDAAVSFNYQSIVCHANLGHDFPYPSANEGFGPRYNSYLTSDGRVVLLAAAEPKFWHRFCEVVGRADLAEGQHEFSYGRTGVDGEREQAEIAAIIATRTAAQWMELAVERELAMTPIHDPSELLELEQTVASGMLAHTTSIGDDQQFRHVSFPASIEHAPFSPGSAAPAFGADSTAVLTSYGVGIDEIADLQAGGAVLGALAR